MPRGRGRGRFPPGSAGAGLDPTALPLRCSGIFRPAGRSPDECTSPCRIGSFAAEVSCSDTGGSADRRYFAARGRRPKWTPWCHRPYRRRQAHRNPGEDPARHRTDGKTFSPLCRTFGRCAWRFPKGLAAHPQRSQNGRSLASRAKCPSSRGHSPHLPPGRRAL